MPINTVIRYLMICLLAVLATFWVACGLPSSPVTTPRTPNPNSTDIPSAAATNTPASTPIPETGTRLDKGPMEINLAVDEKELCAGGDLPFTLTFVSTVDMLDAIVLAEGFGIVSVTQAPDRECGNIPANQAVSVRGTFRITEAGEGQLRANAQAVRVQALGDRPLEIPFGRVTIRYFLATDGEILTGASGSGASNLRARYEANERAWRNISLVKYVRKRLDVTHQVKIIDKVPLCE